MPKGIPPLPKGMEEYMLSQQGDNYDPKTMILAPPRMDTVTSQSTIAPNQEPTEMISFQPEKIRPPINQESIPVPGSEIPRTPAKANPIAEAVAKLGKDEKEEVQKKIKSGADPKEIIGTIMSFIGQGMSGLGAASRAYVGDMGGTAQHLSQWDKIGKERANFMGTRDQRDPASEVSQRAREIAKMAGLTVGENATYDSLKKIIPGFQAIVQQDMANRNKKDAQRDGQAYRDKQLELQEKKFDYQIKEAGRRGDSQTFQQLTKFKKDAGADIKINRNISRIEEIIGGKVGSGIDYPGATSPIAGGWLNTRKWSYGGDKSELWTLLKDIEREMIRASAGTAQTASEMKAVLQSFDSSLKSEETMDKTLARIKEISNKGVDLYTSGMSEKARGIALEVIGRGGEEEKIDSAETMEFVDSNGKTLRIPKDRMSDPEVIAALKKRGVKL